MRSLGLLALLVVSTAAAHAAVAPVRRWMGARTERIADVELAVRERALARCLVGAPVQSGVALADRLAAIETALVVGGEGVGNDAAHWPGRCAPLVRETAELVHLGRSTMKPWEVEALGLVLGEGRPVRDALRVMASLSALPADATGPRVDAMLAPVGGDPPRPMEPELSRESLPTWSATGLDLVPFRVDDAGVLVRGIASGRKSHSWWSRNGVMVPRGGGAHETPPPQDDAGRPCQVRAGDWLLDACSVALRAIPPEHVGALDAAPLREPPSWRLLGVLDAAPPDLQASASQRWTSCLHDGRLLAIALHAQEPRHRARLIPVVDGTPRAALVPEAPAHQVRCDDGIEVVGVRETARRRFVVQRDRCDARRCVADSVELAAMGIPTELLPEEATDVAVAALPDALVLVWASARHGVFFKRGRLEELAGRPIRLLARRAEPATPSTITAASVGRRAVFVLESWHARDDHVVIDLGGDGPPVAITVRSLP